jgi:hypothetical protein
LGGVVPIDIHGAFSFLENAAVVSEYGDVGVRIEFQVSGIGSLL